MLPGMGQAARRILLVSHDAGGTIPPMLALAEAFVSRGHDVAWLGQPSIERRAVSAGCRFSSFPGIPDYESRVPLEEQIPIAVAVITGHATGVHVVSEATRQGSDLIIVDANMAGAAAAAESLDQPSAVLLHSMYATIVDTWLAEIWPALSPLVNQTRQQFGLAPCDGWADVFARHDRVISVVPELFDAPVVDRPVGLRHFGFLVPAAHVGDPDGRFPEGDAPAVLVGLSSTYQHQERLLQEILDALGELEVRGLASTAGQVDLSALRCPPNVVLREFVDYHEALTETDVMVTHAGLGTVAAALSRGVPLVCTPIGRDQDLNAQRVVSLGAGLSLGRDPDTAHIVEAVQAVLADLSYRDGAVRIADDARRGGGQTAAVKDLEDLLSSTDSRVPGRDERARRRLPQ